jgi:hypothetical protein
VCCGFPQFLQVNTGIVRRSIPSNALFIPSSEASLNKLLKNGAAVLPISEIMEGRLLEGCVVFVVFTNKNGVVAVTQTNALSSSIHSMFQPR